MRSIPQPLRHNSIWIITLLVIIGSSIHLDFTPLSVAENLDNSLVILDELLEIDLSVADTVFFSIIETLEMALIGSSIGFAISIPAALMASKNIFPIYISAIFRAILGILWSIPPLLWAIVLVSVAGLGPTAGILAITAFSI
jgi:phosphonate transport system permease protein